MADNRLTQNLDKPSPPAVAGADGLNLVSLTGAGGQADLKTDSRVNQPPNKATDSLPSLQISDASAGHSDATKALTPGDHQQTLKVDGKDRQFEVHIPAGYDGHSKLPVVYMLPGLTESKDQMKEYSQMNQVADQKGFAVVYLQALPQDFPGSFGLYKENSWNLDHGTLTNKDPSYDDMNYVKAVKGAVEGETNIDSRRQYLAGFSEGGQAAQYIAHEMPHTFAGLATVHSTRLDSDPKPRPDDPTAMMAVLGDDDNVLPIKGGHGFGEGYWPMKGWMLATVPKVSESKPLEQAPAWAAADGDTTATTTSNKDQTVTKYTGGSAPVEQIVRHSQFHWSGSQGGQHSWDGGDSGFGAVQNPDLIQDISKYDRHSDPSFNTSEAVADFLLQNKKP